MSIDKYINWAQIWEEEICLKTAKDICGDDGDDKFIHLIDCFLQENNMELMPDECRLNENKQLVFFFAETGGQNESDTQGWSRDYTFVFDTEDYMFISVEYSQG